MSEKQKNVVAIDRSWRTREWLNIYPEITLEDLVRRLEETLESHGLRFRAQCLGEMVRVYHFKKRRDKHLLPNHG